MDNYGKLLRKAMTHRRGETNAGIAETVHEQLAEDFPDRWTGWVRSAQWDGPEDVPLESVDFEKKKTWSAKPDDAKVRRFMRDIEADKVKPAVLVNEPNNDKMVIADGHHRALAAQELGVPVKAYVATVGAVNGDWLLMHSHQFKRDADGAKSDK